MEDYEKGVKLGEGTFGSVYKAVNKKTGMTVAIKKIRLGSTSEGINMTALREIKILRELSSSHVIRLLDVFPQNKNLSLVFEFMVSDLEAIIKDRATVLSAADIKAYMQHILLGLRDCHRSWTLHRDMKPNNCLISPTGEIKLGDFGLSRIFGSPDRRLTPQVFARWYRAPELLFGSTAYGPGVDVWGAGCILAELLLRRPWLPGSNDIEQLVLIFSALGIPTEDSWPGVTGLPAYVEFTGVAVPPLRSQFPAASNDALDLLSHMVCMNPNGRYSAQECLDHSYFTNDPAPTPPAKLPQPVSRESNPLLAPPKPDQPTPLSDEPPAKKRRGATAAAMVPTSALISAAVPASPGMAADAAGKFSPRLAPPVRS